ncbi:hypothetical protein WDU94_011232 [Cyamophila willieti]
MSQFAFFNDLNSAVNMDEPITKGPAPRWQRKNKENSVEMNMSSFNSSNSISSNDLNKSRGNEEKRRSQSVGRKTPKTPSKKSPGRHKSNPNTPSAKSKTPSGGDRYIPNRSAINAELSHYLLTRDENNDGDLSPSEREKQKAMSQLVHGKDIQKSRVLSFQNKAPPPPDGYQNSLKVVYSTSKTPMGSKPTSRYIPLTADRILDAPEILNDYYLNLIDWSHFNVLAVALGSSIYLWNADTGAIDHLMDLENNESVCSVAWIQEGFMLGVGTSLGTVQLWDVSAKKKCRTMDGHDVRVGSLAWNSYILSSGSRSGNIIHHDVRSRDHKVALLQNHTQEVCGLKWSPDGRHLASGGNDNLLNVWSGMPGQHTFSTQPIHSFNRHQAAVKAIAWCPWSPNTLASGGGTADRHIHFWNVSSGACLDSIDTKSQVCALLWNSDYKELVSAHGFAQNQLIIWKYPSLVKVAELHGHSARVLNLAMSPDETTVLSAGADETLRLWKIFEKVKSKKKEIKNNASKFNSMFNSIR